MKNTILAVVTYAALLTACTTNRRVPLDEPIAGQYHSRIELFLVYAFGESGDTYALALPSQDKYFFGSQLYGGAPSISAWESSPDAYPHVIKPIPIGTTLILKSVRKDVGFSYWYGFTSFNYVECTIDGTSGIIANDLIEFDDDQRPIRVKSAYLKKVGQSE